MDHNKGSTALREWMTANGKTQAEVGAMLKVRQTQVSDWLLGRRMSLANAIAVRDAIGVPVEAWVQAPVVQRKRRVAA